MLPERARLVDSFVADAGWGSADRHLLAADASFRRYYRLGQHDHTAVLMDAPPEFEDVHPFIKVARLLSDLGCSAPAILAADAARGLVLLEDFGDDTYTRLIANGGDEAALYGLAVDVLTHLHGRFDPVAEQDSLPPYDDRRLLAEAALLVDWYLPAVRAVPTSQALRREYLALWRDILPQARRAPDSLVLRDYHVDNLMRLKQRRGVGACGLLDFQDAVIGPVSYDLVSLLEDARRRVAATLRERMLARYLAAFPALDRAAFAASYAVLGAQRSAKIIGIFTRLSRRDRKPQYLAHIPRVWRWLEGDLEHPALASLRAWFDHHVPPARRIAPAAE